MESVRRAVRLNCPLVRTATFGWLVSRKVLDLDQLSILYLEITEAAGRRDILCHAAAEDGDFAPYLEATSTTVWTR